MSDEHLQFAPSKVDGFPNVTEVIIHPEYLKILSDNQWSTFHFDDIAQYPRPKWIWRCLKRTGLYSSQPFVGEREWFNAPAERFVRFYTKPEITIFMPVNEPEKYFDSYYWRAQIIILKGDFHTCDLG